MPTVSVDGGDGQVAAVAGIVIAVSKPCRRCVTADVMRLGCLPVRICQCVMPVAPFQLA